MIHVIPLLQENERPFSITKPKNLTNKAPSVIHYDHNPKIFINQTKNNLCSQVIRIHLEDCSTLHFLMLTIHFSFLFFFCIEKSTVPTLYLEQYVDRSKSVGPSQLSDEARCKGISCLRPKRNSLYLKITKPLHTS